ncbi:unnamed protein product [Effrenium voratum]|nr:unnamed protein product [Effrenium voratum]
MQVAHIDGVLQRDVEASEARAVRSVPELVEETPAEVVARDPGPALLAAREASSLFGEIDTVLPRSKLKAYEMLMRTGAVDVHRFVEENMQGALNRGDEGVAWVQKVLSRKDRNPGQANWTKKALSHLEQEKADRRVALGLGSSEGVF